MMYKIGLIYINIHKYDINENAHILSKIEYLPIFEGR